MGWNPTEHPTPKSCHECGRTNPGYSRSPLTGRATSAVAWCDRCYERLSGLASSEQLDKPKGHKHAPTKYAKPD